ncbi:MAG: protein of unknown function (DUF1064) [Namikivirus tsukuho]|uniref:DUF1064 domain-containing protein n=1 Tax=Bacteriophage sp. TaxID=38018 RepID=A0ABY5TRC2_9VIRU|nr:MAG: protein of unknown function (DUF1064) [Bacteriophage sp.]
MWGGRSKYHARRTTVDGVTFDSKREADRYLVLKSMEEDGTIEDLRRQVRYELIPAFDVDGKHFRPIFYVADFVYVEGGREVVEDVKGMRTDVYRLKSKLFARRYGKAIKET